MLKVFYLDDEEELCEIFSEMFTSDEVNVKTFVDPKESISASKLDQPDIFFIDYRLPGITGDEVAQDLKQSIPKILVTGDLSYTPNYKFQKVISKPYNFDEVRKLIKSYIAA